MRRLQSNIPCDFVLKVTVCDSRPCEEFKADSWLVFGEKWHSYNPNRAIMIQAT